MTNQIFFSADSRRRGDCFDFNGPIRSAERRSYELEEWIGRGGNAAVYRCREGRTGDEYAIKFLMRSGFRPAGRFAREIKLLKSLTGEHITRYRGSGQLRARRKDRNQDENLLFVVMELADSNLREVMQRTEGSIGYDKYAGQFRGLASALASLHAHAVHRDIKPENILVAGDRWLLSDYGLCTFVNDDQDDDLTPEQANVGPKFWPSPEAQNRRLGLDDNVNAASDVFQLAAVFWYVVTGRHPSGIVTRGDWTGPKKLFRLLHRSLFHDYKRRPQNGSEFLADLEDALTR